MIVLIVIFLIICAIAIFWGYTDVQRSEPIEPPKQVEDTRKSFRYTEDEVQYVAYEGSEMYTLILKAINRRGR